MFKHSFSFFYHPYWWVPFLGAILLFLLIWAGFTDVILDVVEVFALGALCSRLLTHFTQNKGRSALAFGKLPIRLFLPTLGGFWLVHLMSNTPILPIAWFLATFEDLFELFSYFQD